VKGNDPVYIADGVPDGTPFILLRYKNPDIAPVGSSISWADPTGPRIVFA
jgi:hypothetical protein